MQLISKIKDDVADVVHVQATSDSGETVKKILPMKKYIELLTDSMEDSQKWYPLVRSQMDTMTVKSTLMNRIHFRLRLLYQKDYSRLFMEQAVTVCLSRDWSL